MKKIPLTQGYFALVDDEDFAWLSKHKWQVSKFPNTDYAVRSKTIRYKKREKIQMHRLIVGLSIRDKQECDHIDGNGLNNQKNNLRVCSRQQNRHNSKSNKCSSSQYKGVAWHKQHKKWGANITINEKAISLGSFNDELQAARAYDLAAIYYFGDFANTNFNESNYENLTFDPNKHVGRFQPDTRGSKHGGSKLTETKVITIKRLLREMITQREIARRFGVHETIISKIKLGKAWKHV